MARTSSRQSKLSSFIVPLTADPRELRRMTRNAIVGIVSAKKRQGRNLMAREILSLLDVQHQLTKPALYALVDEAAREFGISKERVFGPNCPQNRYYISEKSRISSLIYYAGELYTARKLALLTSNVHGLDHETIRYRVCKLGWSAERALTEVRRGGSGRPKQSAVAVTTTARPATCDTYIEDTMDKPKTQDEIDEVVARIFAYWDERERQTEGAREVKTKPLSELDRRLTEAGF